MTRSAPQTISAAQPAMLRLSLPFPPSVWEIYEGWGKSRHRSPAYNAWLTHAGHMIRGRNEHPISVPFSCAIALQRPSKRSDLDNRAKAVLDALQKFGVIKNDNLLERLTMTWDAGMHEECVVLVMPSGEALAA